MHKVVEWTTFRGTTILNIKSIDTHTRARALIHRRMRWLRLLLFLSSLRLFAIAVPIVLTVALLLEQAIAIVTAESFYRVTTNKKIIEKYVKT